MVVCRKHNVDPRRKMDLQDLNAASVRQCHPTAPPFQQAIDVLYNTKQVRGSYIDVLLQYMSINRFIDIYKYDVSDISNNNNLYLIYAGHF